MRVKRREFADEVTVSRDKPPLLLWEQARPPTPDLTAEALSPVGCLSGSAGRLITNTHLGQDGL